MLWDTCSWTIKRPRDAKDAFESILRFHPKSADADFGLGITLAADENHQGAVEEYRSAGKLDPELEGVYYNLGLSLTQLKMYDEAMAAYLKEQQNNGDEFYIETALAAAYRAKGMQQHAADASHKTAQRKRGN